MVKKNGREEGIKEGIPLGDNSFQKNINNQNMQKDKMALGYHFLFLIKFARV